VNNSLTYSSTIQMPTEADEAAYIEALWQVADTTQQGSLAGNVAVNFFLNSQLPPAVGIASANEYTIFLKPLVLSVGLRILIVPSCFFTKSSQNMCYRSMMCAF